MSSLGTYQARVKRWMMECFSMEVCRDIRERNHRFLEEALELVQACDCTASEAYQLVDYVFGRAVGEKKQEAGGVLVTLAALCEPNEIDMVEAGEAELLRIWTKIDKIREKQAAKPRHSPLPEGPSLRGNIGWAVCLGGKIIVETVSPTRHAAIVNWLYVAKRIPLTNRDSDAFIEAMWNYHSDGVECMVPVTITGVLPIAPDEVSAPDEAAADFTERRCERLQRSGE